MLHQQTVDEDVAATDAADALWEEKEQAHKFLAKYVVNFYSSRVFDALQSIFILPWQILLVSETFIVPEAEVDDINVPVITYEIPALSFVMENLSSSIGLIGK